LAGKFQETLFGGKVEETLAARRFAKALPIASTWPCDICGWVLPRARKFKIVKRFLAG